MDLDGRALAFKSPRLGDFDIRLGARVCYFKCFALRDCPDVAPTEATTVDLSEFGSPASINKITWQKAGRVTEPGRYMLKFGWLTVTADDLAIWR